MESGIKQDLNLDMNTPASTNEVVTSIFFSLKISLKASLKKRTNRRSPTYGRASGCLWGGTRRAASCPRPACRLSATASCSYSSEPRAGWPRWRPGARPPCPGSGAGGCSWTLRAAAPPPRCRRAPAAPAGCPSCWAPSRPHLRLQEGRCCQTTPGTGKQDQECSNTCFGFAFSALTPLFLPRSWGFCFSSLFPPVSPAGLGFGATLCCEGRAQVKHQS